MPDDTEGGRYAIVPHEYEQGEPVCVRCKAFGPATDPGEECPGYTVTFEMNGEELLMLRNAVSFFMKGLEYCQTGPTPAWKRLLARLEDEGA